MSESSLPGRGRTPASYLPASWRGTLPVDAEGRMGISLNMGDGAVVRVALDVASAKGLAETVLQSIEHALPAIELSNDDVNAAPAELGRIVISVLPDGRLGMEQWIAGRRDAVYSLMTDKKLYARALPEALAECRESGGAVSPDRSQDRG